MPKPVKTTNVAGIHAETFELQLQKKGESDEAFRSRVSSTLRDMGHVIEAHEAYQDDWFDQNSDVQTALLGYTAQAMQNRDYGLTDGEQVGMDIAAGEIAKAPKHDDDGLLIAFAMLFGSARR